MTRAPAPVQAQAPAPTVRSEVDLRWGKVQGAVESQGGLDTLAGIQEDTRGPWAAANYELAQTYFTILTGRTVLGIATQLQTLGLLGEPGQAFLRYVREGVWFR